MAQTMTLQEIYERLGLLVPTTQNMKEIHHLVKEQSGGILAWPRGSGRTTRDLVEALYHSQFGQVLFLVHTQWYVRDLQKRVRGWADLLGLDHKNIRIETPRDPIHYMGLRLQHSDIDHVVWEYDGGVSPELVDMLKRITRALEPCSESREHGPQDRST